MDELIDKVAIITGASSGIGRATAKQLAKAGARIVVAARRKNILQTLVSEIRESGGEAFAVAGDVGQELFAKTLVETTVERFGRLDIAFNNAGILGDPAPVTEVSLKQWEKTININLTAAFLGAKYQIPAIKNTGGGSMIFTSSFVGYSVGLAEMAAYSASKAGLIGLTQSLAVEYGTSGIRINAILPGGTETPMSKSFAHTAEAVEQVKNLHAMKRMASADEIARSVLYLASDASSFMTGTAMLVDGGVSICRS